jgi:hypothetical protein
MKCVILQPSYIPWRGYFHLIQKADVFIFYDDVQYDKHGWRNRNLIKGPHGPQWLTIPVASRGAVSQRIPISEVRIVWDRDWARVHWGTLCACYAKAPYFRQYADFLEPFYTQRPELLADYTIEMTVTLARQLGIEHTQFVRSSSLGVGGARTERLIKLLAHVGATHYVSGPSARDYMEERLFDEAGITLEYMEYDYPEYPQRYAPFHGQLSILDLLFMVGSEAPSYIWESRVSTATINPPGQCVF